MVTPQPIGGAGDVLAHVILAQHQHRGFISALITTLAPEDDPWDPPRVALKLPTVVDKALLIQESGLFPYCPPFLPFNVCRAHSGDIEILQDQLTDAQSGDGFLCVAEALPAPATVPDADTLHGEHIRGLFAKLAGMITSVVTSLDCAVSSMSEWVLQNKDLDQAICHVQRDIVAYIDRLIPADRSPGLVGDDAGSHPSPDCWSSNSVLCSGPTVPIAAQRGVPFKLARELVQQLQVLWLAKAHRQDSSEAHFCVKVWFSDHLQSAEPGPPISVSLPVDSDLWIDAFLRPWNRVLSDSSDIQIVVAQFRGLPQPEDADATVIIVQNPISLLSTALLAVFPDSRTEGTPDYRLATVAEPFSRWTLEHAVRSLPEGCLSDPAWHFDFTWGCDPFDAVGPPGRHHGECFGVFPRLVCEPWGGLVDGDFACLIQSVVPARQEPVVQPVVSAPVRISLQASLPLCLIDPASQNFNDTIPAIAISEEANWKKRIGEQELPRLLGLPDGMSVPPATYWSLVDPTPLDPLLPSWAELYVDGSTSATAAAWSVVVVRTDGVASLLVGSLYGQVSLADQSPDWIGAATVDNIAAEFSAFAIALDLACRMVPVKVVIRPDLQLSAMLAKQQCVTASNPRLAQLISVLAAWLPVDASICEVRGHTDHPWNDLADAIARWALSHDPPNGHSFPVLHQLAVSAADLNWAWIQGAPTSLFQSLPPICDQQVCQFPLSLRKVPVDRAPVAVSDPKSTCELNVFSLNVLALDSVNQQTLHGRQRGQRTARLDLLWHQAQAHIIGLQEARTLPGRHVTDHYMIFASGFEDPRAPRFGCEIWLHRSLPFVAFEDGTSICAPEFKFAVVHADPRRLMLRADHVSCSFMVTVLHAPCLGKTRGNGHRPIDDIDQWWQETSRLLEKCAPATYHWLCVDANAPLATHETDCFALAHAEASNPQGALFEDFLLRHQLAVPATFSDIHPGEAWTWTHSSGSRCRRDYILVPLHTLPCVHESFIMKSYDGSFCHEDHIPVGIRFSAFLPARSGTVRMRWDELAFLDPVRVEQFQSALRTLPLPTWDVRTTDHCALYEDQVVQLSQQFFGGKSRQRARPQLSPATASMIAFKRHLLDLGRAWELMTDATFKAELREVEKVVRKAVYADLACFYDQLLVRLQDADQMADAKQLYRILDRLGRRKHKQGGQRPLPLLKAPDGSTLQSFQQQQHTWLRQFAATEAGVPMSWSALYDLCRPGLARSDFEIDPDAFVSPWQLLQAMRKLRRGKACGPNNMPPDLIKAGGAVFAMQLSCLTNKVVAHAHEPTSWRGGQTCPAL